jgi:hypothetical protein
VYCVTLQIPNVSSSDSNATVPFRIHESEKRDVCSAVCMTG